MDAVSLKLARNYTNERLNSLPSNAPTKTVTFDGGIYSVGSDVVNGQVSDVRIKEQTWTNLAGAGDTSPQTVENLDAAKTYLLINSAGANVEIDTVDTPTPVKLTGETSFDFVWASGKIALYELSTEEAALEASVLGQRYHYVSGTKSTNSVRVKSVGKNIWDGNYQVNRGIDGSNGNIIPGSGWRTTTKIKCESNTQYTVSGGNRNNWRFEDANGNCTGFATTATATTPNNTSYMYVYYSSDDTHEEVDDDMIVSGSISPYFDPNSIRPYIDALRLNTVNVPVKVIVPDVSSSLMGIDQVSKEVAIEVVQYLKSQGMKVILEPYPWIAGGTVPETEWQPNDINLWFWNWKTTILQPLIEEIANPYGVEYLNVASNFVNMEYVTGYWQDTFAFVRSLYSGKIIYRTNWWVTAVWAPETIQTYNNKLYNPLFGDPNLDIISVACYFELTDTPVPSVDELLQCLRSTTKYNRQQNVYQEIKNFYEVWGKPILFGELGFASYERCASEPWNPNPSSTYSEEAQSNCFQAYMEMFLEEPWFTGFSVYCIGDTISPYSVLNKAAEIVIRSWGRTKKEWAPVMINKGSSALPHEPYKESSVIINLPEPLRSVPNVKDEISIGAGGTVKTKRISDDIPVSNTVYDSIDTETYTNVDVIKTTVFGLAKAGTIGVDGQTRYYDKNGVELTEVAQADIDLEASAGKYYWGEDKKLYIIVAKGDYADIAAARTGLDVTSLNYQLATPIVTKLPAQAPLQVYENGTVYVEPIGDPSETTLPTVELTIPTGTSNKFGVATHDYDGAAADWELTNSESKCFLLAVSNAGGSANIIAPDAPGVMYAISNASGQTVTVKISGGTGVDVNTGKKVLVIHDGTDYTALTAEL